MKRGFTLVELLAVIAILAIISLIAVPIVINIINDTKIESLKKSMHFYIDAVEKNISSRQIIDPDYEPDECIIQKNGNVICSQNSEVLKISETSNELEIAMKGKKPSSGTIRLQDGKVIDIIDIYLDGKTANYDEKKNIVFSTLQIPTEPGLYDADGKLIANWEETKVALGLDLDSDGYLHCPTDEEWNEEICVRDDSVLSNAKTLVISDEVKNISGNYMEEAAFYGLTELTNVVIPNSVESIGDAAFRDCTSLTSVTFEKNSKLKSIGDAAFFGCTSLTNITIPNSVTSIGNGSSDGDGAFEGCTSLTSITIPSSVSSIGDSAFSGCTGLTNITIPNSVTSIGKYVFSGCTGLTSATFNNTTGWYLTNWNNSEHTDIDVTNPSTNATNLKSTYRDRYWKRS